MPAGQSVTIFNCRIPCAIAGAGKLSAAPAANDPAALKMSRRLMTSLLWVHAEVEVLTSRRQVPANNIPLCACSLLKQFATLWRSTRHNRPEYGRSALVDHDSRARRIARFDRGSGMQASAPVVRVLRDQFLCGACSRCRSLRLPASWRAVDLVETRSKVMARLSATPSRDAQPPRRAFRPRARAGLHRAREPKMQTRVKR